MIPRTFPSTYASNGQQQMVVYFLPSIAGLQRWLDYIPVKLAQGGVENSYANNGYIDVTVVSYPTATQQAWKEYIPVYLDDAATDAWLVNASGYIPYGYALFSDASMIMDMTNTGALDSRVTFSRASNATLFDSAGNLVYAPHNLLTQSESLDSSVWSLSDITISANNAVSPDGTTTADLITEGSAGTAFLTRGAGIVVPGGATIAASCYVKRSAAVNWVRFRLSNSAATNGGNVWFDIQNGALGTAANIGSGTGTAGAIQAVGSGWYRLSVTTTIASADTTGLPLLCSASADNNTSRAANSAYWLWGAQLNVGSLQPYYSTTVKNLSGYSQEFDDAAWTKTGVTVTANATAALDGSATAELMLESAVTSTHRLSRVGGSAYSVLSGTTYAFSIFVKNASGSRNVVVNLGALFNARAFFDLSTGTVASTTAGTASIVSVGNGWYRCTVFGTATSTHAVSSFPVGLADSTTETYAGDGTSGVFIWGAQLSDSASLDQYVYNPVAAPTSVAYYGPRFDYDPATLAARGLLIEEQRTNSIRNSVGVGAVAGTPGTLPTNWTITGAGVGTLSRDVVGVGSANGINYVDVRYYGTTSTTGFSISFEPNTGGITATTGQTWAASNYIALVGGSIANISFIRAAATTGRNAAGGATTDSANTGDNKAALTTTLQRFSVSTTLADANTVNIQPNFGIGFSSGVSIDITLRIGLPQLELGAFATSVIPTTTAAATRAADVATMIGDNFANWYNASEGTLFADLTPVGMKSVIGQAFLQVDDGTTSNRIIVGAGSSNTTQMNTVAGGVGDGSCTTPATTYTAGIGYRNAFAVKANDLQAAINGTAGTVDTTATMPVSVGNLRIGANLSATSNVWFRRFAYYPRRLAGSELQAVTA